MSDLINNSFTLKGVISWVLKQDYHLLNKHLALLIKSTKSCDSLSVESVATTLFIIQEQVR